MVASPFVGSVPTSSDVQVPAAKKPRQNRGLREVLPYVGQVFSDPSPNLELAISMPFMALTLLVTFTAPWWLERKNRLQRERLAQWKQWLEQQGL